MKTGQLTAFLLGMAVALLAVLVLQHSQAQPQQAVAAEGNSAAADLIAFRLAADKLVIIDAPNRKAALYELTNNELRLKCARNLRYDLRIESEVSSSRGLSYSDVRKMQHK